MEFYKEYYYKKNNSINVGIIKLGLYLSEIELASLKCRLRAYKECSNNATDMRKMSIDEYLISKLVEAADK